MRTTARFMAGTVAFFRRLPCGVNCMVNRTVKGMMRFNVSLMA